MKVGLLRVQGALVALPVDVLREVVPLPERFDALPTAARAGRGGAAARDRPARPGPRRAQRDDGRHRLPHGGDGRRRPRARRPRPRGARRQRPRRRHPRPGGAATGGRRGAAPVHGGVRPAGHRRGRQPARPGRRLRRPRGARDDQRPDAEGGPPAGTGTGLDPAHLVVRCTSAGGAGDVLLAIDVADVQTTLPSLSPRPSQLSSAWCLGVTDHGDVRLPVVDPLALLGCPGRPVDVLAGPARPLRAGAPRARLRRGARHRAGGAVGALDGTALARSGGRRRPGRGPPAPGPAFVLDVAALLADPEVSALTSLNTGPGAAAPAGEVTGQVTAAPATTPSCSSGPAAR